MSRYRRRPSARRAAIALLPTVLTTVVLLGLYFVAPLDRPWTPRTTVVFVLGLVLLGVVVTWQAWAVVQSPHPRLRAAVVLAISFPVLILLFAVSYLLLDHDRPGSFSEPLGRIGSLYFTVTVFTTVGFGDINARTSAARVIVIVQMLVDLGYIGLLARAIVEAARIGVRRKESPPGKLD